MFSAFSNSLSHSHKIHNIWLGKKETCKEIPPSWCASFSECLYPSRCSWPMYIFWFILMFMPDSLALTITMTKYKGENYTRLSFFTLLININIQEPWKELLAWCHNHPNLRMHSVSTLKKNQYMIINMYQNIQSCVCSASCMCKQKGDGLPEVTCIDNGPITTAMIPNSIETSSLF